ncbi:MAG: DUF917 domain-containing protein [Chloroflexota bacterium]
MRLLYEENLEHIATGAAVLGTGGGGDPYIGTLMAVDAVKKHGPIKLISIDELDEDDLVIPTAMMGAPVVLVEKLPTGNEFDAAFDSISKFMGSPVKATMSLEIGGMNSMLPLATAAQYGLPIVDADGMGRAFPELQMVTQTMYGISATPLFISDSKGNSGILNTISNHWTETFARSLTVDMGARAFIALYPATAGQLKESSILGSITLAETIGRSIREAQAANRDVVKVLCDSIGAFELFRGKVNDVERRTEGGFNRGELKIAGIKAFEGDNYTVELQNEFLVAFKNGEVIASTPDLITLLNDDTGEPVTTEAVRYGARVVALGIPSNPQWRKPEGLELVGPRYFGYDIDYIPIEERQAG